MGVCDRIRLHPFRGDGKPEEQAVLTAAKGMKPLGELNRSLRPEVWGLLGRLGGQEASSGLRLGAYRAEPDGQEDCRGKPVAPLRRNLCVFAGVEVLQAHR